MLHPGPPQPSGQQFQGPSLPPLGSLWQRPNLKEHLAGLLQNAAVLSAISDELEAIQTVELVTPASGHKSKLSEVVTDDPAPDDRNSNPDCTSVSTSMELLLETVRETYKLWPDSVSFALQAAKQLQDVIKLQLQPLQEVLDGNAGSQKTPAVTKLVSKQQKLLRNRKWRRRKRRGVAEALHKERDRYEEADREADEWRAKEIAKSIAKRKMEKMKALAEKKAKEEKARHQQETEMVVLVEKLQELRALRIAKLKKQGCFFPDEDNQFMEKVRAAVAEEERQAAAAANTSAAATAISNAEEARKAASAVASSSEFEDKEDEKTAPSCSKIPPSGAHDEQSFGNKAHSSMKAGSVRVDDKAAKVDQERNSSGLLEVYEGLPAEFHHYYLGSSYDMGTLIEVRQGWDAFIMPGGSRIPQHWVEPPLPSDPVWTSYLVKPKPPKRLRRAEQGE